MAKTYTWWCGDEIPPLFPLPELCCQGVTDVALLAKLRNVEPVRIETRLADTNTAYVAIIEDLPAGYDWSGANSVRVVDVYWPITPPNRGLWDFFTFDKWRGRGIYPHVLQAILRSE